MSPADLPKKIASCLCKEDLIGASKIVRENPNKDESKKEVNHVLEQVAHSLFEEYKESESLDSLSDGPLTGYFYLIACLDDYKEFFKHFDEKLPLDYEALLFKAIEIEDAHTVTHIIQCKPDLLNIRLRRPFKVKKMKDFLLSCPWMKDCSQEIQNAGVSNEEEPTLSDEWLSFEAVEKTVKERQKAS